MSIVCQLTIDGIKSYLFREMDDRALVHAKWYYDCYFRGHPENKFLICHYKSLNEALSNKSLAPDMAQVISLDELNEKLIRLNLQEALRIYSEENYLFVMLLEEERISVRAFFNKLTGKIVF